jgi:HAD superfamily phosphatase (TIGR01668 family)
MSSSLTGLQESRPRGRFSFHTPSSSDCVVDPRLPHEIVREFCEIDFDRLAAKGVHKICLDVDNTLLGQTAEILEPAVVNHLKNARERGSISNVCIISNVIWNKGKRGDRLRRLAYELDIPLVYGATFLTRKPTPAPYEWALRSMESCPAETAMVGDQIFADVLGANRLGLYTILVKPTSKDHWTTTLIGRRLRESLLLRYYMLSR